MRSPRSRARVRWTIVGVAAAVLATGAATGAYAGVQPGPSANPPACPFSSTLCLYDQKSFGGERFTLASINPSGTCVNLASHGWGAGRAKSAINTNAKAATLYSSTDCSGAGSTVRGSSSLPTLGIANANSAFVFGF